MTNNLKNYLKIGSLLIGVSLLLWNCEQESDIDIEPQNSTYNVAHKNFDFIVQNKSLLNKVGFLSKKKNNLASRENNTNDFTIFTDKLTYITPTDGSRESYSFYIERNSRAQTNQIENLILSKDSGEDQYRAHIITYFFPDGLHGEHDNFEITGFEEIDAESVSELYAKSSGCENTYEYVAIETEHDCYSGNHSGADEAESCDGQGTLPYSTWGIHVVVHYQCDGGGMGGDGLGGGGGETEVPGGGGGIPGDNTLPVDAGITLPPTCQTNDCDGEIVANQINELLDSTLSYNDLLWLNDNAMEADALKNLLEDNDWVTKLKLALAAGITTTAELAHDIYNKTAAIAGDNPNLLIAMNIGVKGLKKIVEQVTDTDPQTANWVDLFNMWLFEIGPNPINFDGNDTTTLNLKTQEGVNQARSVALTKTQNNDFSPTVDQWPYGQGEFYDGMANGNIATSFLGTYTTSITAVENENGTITLTFNVTNTSRWSSATRLRIDNDGDGAHDEIIPDKDRGAKILLGGDFTQNWTWSETF